MKQFHSLESNEEDQKVIKLLQDLGSLKAVYPPELLEARRSTFLAQIERLQNVEVEEGLAPGDQEIVNVLRKIKSLEADYPSELLATRRSAFLSQIETTKKFSLLDRLRLSIKSIFQRGGTFPSVPWPDLMRTSLVVASLLVAVLIASLLFNPTAQSVHPSHLPGVAQPTGVFPTSTQEVGTILCKPGDQTPACASGSVDLGQDLANQGNGLARPAVSNDALSMNGSVDKAAYVNDGRSGASWVSKSAHSWIKIDLGKVTTFNSVRLQKGSPGSSDDNNLGQFVISVALSDVYRDGNSSGDETEYAQVFKSEQTGLSGTNSNAEAVTTLFPPVRARFVKVTFEKAGAAIDEVGVFMAQPPEQAEHPTGTLSAGAAEMTATTNTLLLTATRTASPLPTSTPLANETLASLPTDTGSSTETPLPIPTDTPYPSDTPMVRPTDTLPPADTTTPVSTEPLVLDTPIPSSTVVPPTAIPPTVQAPVESTEPIIVTSHDQTLIFTCNGNAVEVRGHANTVTLLGSCSSITVTGNRNSVFWQSGSPIITNNGNDNIISQL